MWRVVEPHGFFFVKKGRVFRFLSKGMDKYTFGIANLKQKTLLPNSFSPQHHLSLGFLSELADLHVCALRRCSRFFPHKTDSAYIHHTLLHGYTTLIIEL